MKWEYRAIRIGHDSLGGAPRVSDFNELGASRWEMVSVVAAGSSGFFAFFKRPKQDVADRTAS